MARQDAESRGERKYRKILSDIKRIEPSIKIRKRTTAHKEGRDRLTGRRGVRARARDRRIWERRYNGTYQYSRAKKTEIRARALASRQPAGGDTTNS